jgi:membrane protease YdiL (CAAX protease family)
LNPADLFAFFVTTYLITWTLWLASNRIASPILAGILFSLGVFTPGIVALTLTARSSGRAAVMDILRRLVAWDVRARWYVFAIGYIFALKLIAAAIHRAALGVWPQFGDLPWYLMFAATIASTLMGGQAGEEIGWRGYALPHLSARFGLGPSSLLLGIIWACWHLPLFFLWGFDTFGQSFPLYALQVTAVSVAIAWLYDNTRGSLLLTMLLHAAANNTKDIVPSAERDATNPWALSHSVVAWLTVALLWLCAVFFLTQMRTKHS